MVGDELGRLAGAVAAVRDDRVAAERGRADEQEAAPATSTTAPASGRKRRSVARGQPAPASSATAVSTAGTSTIACSRVAHARAATAATSERLSRRGRPLERPRRRPGGEDAGTNAASDISMPL